MLAERRRRELHRRAGTCVIDATQAGNADYQPAATVKQSIPVSSGTTTVTAASVEALTLADVQGSPAYQKLNANQKAALTAVVKAAVTVLGPVGPRLSPLANALLVAVYEVEVTVLRAGGYLSAAQAATLDAEANSLR